MKIMTVDDSKMVRTIIRRAVTSLEYECLEANNPKEALKILAEEHKNIKLILLDWNMPEMTGLEFLEIIKAHPEYKEIPVMMITSQGLKEKILQAIKAGAINYVVKPFTHEDLIERIKCCARK